MSRYLCQYTEAMHLIQVLDIKKSTSLHQSQGSWMILCLVFCN